MTSLKEELGNIVDAVNWTFVAKSLGKSNSWLYHKINGIDGNKKPSKISKEELEQFANTLDNIANNILLASSRLRNF